MEKLSVPKPKKPEDKVQGSFILIVDLWSLSPAEVSEAECKEKGLGSGMKI